MICDERGKRRINIALSNDTIETDQTKMHGNLNTSKTEKQCNCNYSVKKCA